MRPTPELAREASPETRHAAGPARDHRALGNRRHDVWLYCTRMPRLRRLTAVLVHVLMLHLLLVGGGDACVLPAVTAALHNAVAGAVAGTVAPGAVTMAGMQDGSVHEVGACDAPSSESPGERSRPGPAPVCQTLAPCAPAALPATVAPVRERATARVCVATTGHVERAPAARVTAPEPPPPRA